MSDQGREKAISKGKVTELSELYQEESEDEDVWYKDITVKYWGRERVITQSFDRMDSNSKEFAEEAYEVGDEYILSQWQINNYFED